MPTRIGTIENYYGGLVVEEINGKYYWAIQDGNTIEYQEIPQYLYSALLRFEDTDDEFPNWF